MLATSPLEMLQAIALVQMAAVIAAWLLRRQERLLREKLPYLVSLAVGVLLATALLHLVPEAVAQLGNRRAVWATLAGTVLALFSLERIFFSFTGATAEPSGLEAPHLHTHHHHPGEGEFRTHATRPANLMLASTLHSLVDGAAIATAFAADRRLGWLTALGVTLHEVPHRIGDFALLLHLGMPVARALRFAVAVGLPSLLGVLLVVLLGGERTAARVAWLLPVSAGSFLYIATVNLMPELSGECRPRRVALELLSLAAGIGIVVLVAGVGGGI